MYVIEYDGDPARTMAKSRLTAEMTERLTCHQREPFPGAFYIFDMPSRAVQPTHSFLLTGAATYSPATTVRDCVLKTP